MGLFSLFSKKEPVVTKAETNTAAQQPFTELDGYRHVVAGTNYRQDEIKSLGQLNSNYSLNKNELIKKGLTESYVYEYTFDLLPAVLEFEPNNPHDPNAIQVLVSDMHVGYIKKGSTSRVRNLINSGEVDKITAKIRGGNAKAVFYDGDSWTMDKTTGEIKVDIYIKTK